MFKTRKFIVALKPIEIEVIETDGDTEQGIIREATLEALEKLREELEDTGFSVVEDVIDVTDK